MRSFNRQIGILLLSFLFALDFSYAQSPKRILIFQTDFGVKDGAVSAMKGVALGVSADLKIFDLTHEIPPYNIWEAGYRLFQTATYWPKGSIFISVVDPGVGSERKSIVLKTNSGHYFVGPDNGQFTLIAESLGIAEVREINEAVNRRKNSGASYTFHGRDVYAFTGARLAAGVITMDKVGNRLPDSIIRITYQKPVFENDVIKGNIPILDMQYGNVWTNIDGDTFKKLGLKYGDNVSIQISKDNKVVYEGTAPYEATFSGVKEGEPLVYLNSLLNVSIALNRGDFAGTYKIASGPGWSITLSKFKAGNP